MQAMQSIKKMTTVGGKSDSEIQQLAHCEGSTQTTICTQKTLQFNESSVFPSLEVLQLWKLSVRSSLASDNDNAK